MQILPTNQLAGTQLGIDATGKLVVGGLLDDTVVPTVQSPSLVDYNRWYICETPELAELENEEVVLYQSLNWVVGNQVPENPTCQKVDVVQEY